MKKTNVILIGVVGVGVVGAYMYMKNKKAQSALLSGSLPAPATNKGTGATSIGKTPSETTSTTQNNEVFLPSNNDMKLVDATVLLGKIKALKVQMKIPFTGRKFSDSRFENENRPSDWTTEYKMYRMGQDSMPKELEKFILDLDDLDYALDVNDNLIKLDPKRNKEWIKIQKLYMSLVNLSGVPLLLKYRETTELAKYGYKVDPITKKLIKI